MSLMKLVAELDKAPTQADLCTANEKQEQVPSLHGEQAVRRKAITELIFFAGVNDVSRCQQIVQTWNIDVSEKYCSDYDQRTPLHIACAEGAFSTAQWLMDKGASVNALDRFKRTPLEEAVQMDNVEIIRILKKQGGRIYEKGGLVDLEKSRIMSVVNLRSLNDFGIDPAWEIDPQDITLGPMIGEGEFGQVFRGNWHGTAVAVKVLKRADDIALGDFRTELNVLSKVHHPNAVQFLGACTKKAPFMMITELMACSMSWASRQVYSMSLPRLVKVALDFACGMAYLHINPPQIIHRDLKPANLMIGGNLRSKKHDLLYDSGVVKIADFGLSKTLQTGYEINTDRYKMTGETGSYRYMAPEVFRHEPYNYKVDVYSFAMIIYELLFQQPPFGDLGAIQAAEQAAMRNARPNLPVPANQTQEQLFKLIHKCWDPNPDARPDFQSIIEELLQIESQLQPKFTCDKEQSIFCGCCIQ